MRRRTGSPPSAGHRSCPVCRCNSALQEGRSSALKANFVTVPFGMFALITAQGVPIARCPAGQNIAYGLHKWKLMLIRFYFFIENDRIPVIIIWVESRALCPTLGRCGLVPTHRAEQCQRSTSLTAHRTKQLGAPVSSYFGRDAHFWQMIELHLATQSASAKSK